MGTTHSRKTTTKGPHREHIPEPEPSIDHEYWNEDCQDSILGAYDMSCETCDDIVESREDYYIDELHAIATTPPRPTKRHRLETQSTPIKIQNHTSTNTFDTSRRSHPLIPNSPSTRWYAPCATPLCPCTASFNGQEDQACTKSCRTHGPCDHNKHTYPRQDPRKGDPRQPPTTKHVARMTREEHKKARQTPTYYRSSHSGSSAQPRG